VEQQDLLDELAKSLDTHRRICAEARREEERAVAEYDAICREVLISHRRGNPSSHDVRRVLRDRAESLAAARAEADRKIAQAESAIERVIAALS
jgi:hypothetical protein